MDGRLVVVTTNPRAEAPYAPENVATKEVVGADAFFALDLRAGRVVSVDDHPEARNPSVRLGVDFGPVIGVLHTLAQVTNYPAEQLIGRMVVGAVNLGPKRIAGFKSQFLVLGAYEPDGTCRLLQVEEGIEPGAPIA
ncbi:MAG: tRNA-binding protein [Actinomycetota bacterium]